MVQINGQPVSDAEGRTLTAYLTQAGYTPSFVAVEKDGIIIPRAQYADTVLCDGDTIEIVQFVGGG